MRPTDEHKGTRSHGRKTEKASDSGQNARTEKNPPKSTALKRGLESDSILVVGGKKAKMKGKKPNGAFKFLANLLHATDKKKTTCHPLTDLAPAMENDGNLTLRKDLQSDSVEKGLNEPWLQEAHDPFHDLGEEELDNKYDDDVFINDSYFEDDYCQDFSSEDNQMLDYVCGSPYTGKTKMGVSSLFNRNVAVGRLDEVPNLTVTCGGSVEVPDRIVTCGAMGEVGHKEVLTNPNATNGHKGIPDNNLATGHQDEVTKSTCKSFNRHCVTRKASRKKHPSFTDDTAQPTAESTSFDSVHHEIPQSLANKARSRLSMNIIISDSSPFSDVNNNTGAVNDKNANRVNNINNKDPTLCLESPIRNLRIEDEVKKLNTEKAIVVEMKDKLYWREFKHSRRSLDENMPQCLPNHDRTPRRKRSEIKPSKPFRENFASPATPVKKKVRKRNAGKAIQTPQTKRHSTGSSAEIDGVPLFPAQLPTSCLVESPPMLSSSRGNKGTPTNKYLLWRDRRAQSVGSAETDCNLSSAISTLIPEKGKAGSNFPSLSSNDDQCPLSMSVVTQWHPEASPIVIKGRGSSRRSLLFEGPSVESGYYSPGKPLTPSSDKEFDSRMQGNGQTIGNTSSPESLTSAISTNRCWSPQFKFPPTSHPKLSSVSPRKERIFSADIPPSPSSSESDAFAQMESEPLYDECASYRNYGHLTTISADDVLTSDTVTVSMPKAKHESQEPSSLTAGHSFHRNTSYVDENNNEVTCQINSVDSPSRDKSNCVHVTLTHEVPNRRSMPRACLDPAHESGEANCPSSSPVPVPKELPCLRSPRVQVTTNSGRINPPSNPKATTDLPSPLPISKVPTPISFSSPLVDKTHLKSKTTEGCLLIAIDVTPVKAERKNNHRESRDKRLRWWRIRQARSRNRRTSQKTQPSTSAQGACDAKSHEEQGDIREASKPNQIYPDYLLLKRTADFLVGRIPERFDATQYFNMAKLIEYLNSYYQFLAMKLQSIDEFKGFDFDLKTLRQRYPQLFNPRCLTVENCVEMILLACLDNDVTLTDMCSDFAFENLPEVITRCPDLLSASPELVLLVLGNDHCVVLNPQGFPISYKDMELEVLKAVSKYLDVNKTGRSEEDKRVKWLLLSATDSNVLQELINNKSIRSCQAASRERSEQSVSKNAEQKCIDGLKSFKESEKFHPRVHHEIQYQRSETYITLPNTRQEYLLQPFLSSAEARPASDEKTERETPKPVASEDVCDEVHSLNKLYFSHSTHIGVPHITRIGMQYAVKGRKIIFTLGSPDIKRRSCKRNNETGSATVSTEACIATDKPTTTAAIDHLGSVEAADSVGEDRRRPDPPGGVVSAINVGAGAASIIFSSKTQAPSTPTVHFTPGNVTKGSNAVSTSSKDVSATLLSPGIGPIKTTALTLRSGEHVNGISVQGTAVLHNIEFQTNKGRRVRAHGLPVPGGAPWTSIPPPKSGPHYCLQALYADVRKPSGRAYIQALGAVWAVASAPFNNLST